MTKRILTSFLLLLNLSISAQTNDLWLSYLKDVKDLFYYKDTIVFTYQKEGRIHGYADPIKDSKLLNSVKDTDLIMLFSGDRETIENCPRTELKSFYSFYISKSNFATLTFITEGKYVPGMSLFNYSPNGKLLKCIEIKSWFIDAGLADSTSSYFKNDSTFVVRRWDGYDLEENGKPILVDSITKINYVINHNGQIIEGEHSKEINKIAPNEK